jgi:hypothetical protein
MKKGAWNANPRQGTIKPSIKAAEAKGARVKADFVCILNTEYGSCTQSTTVTVTQDHSDSDSHTEASKPGERLEADLSKIM